MLKKKISLSTKVFISMILGAIVGLIIGPKITVIAVIGDIFLRLLRMSVVPLIFVNVVLAVAGMGDLKRLGKIGIRLIIIFMITTFISATIGLLTSLFIKPGIGFIMTDIGKVIEKEAPSISTVLLSFFPTNIIQSLAEANMLQIITFAIFSGIAILLMKENDRKIMLDFFGVISRFIMTILKFVIGFTPYGVFVLMANTTGKYGTDVLGPLGKFIITIYIGLIIHAFFIYGGMYFYSVKKGPFDFYKKITPAWTTSLATTSTTATIPISIKVCEEELNLKKDIAGFTIPVGATMNMDGSSLWFVTVAVFVAQVLGIDMSLSEMCIAVLTGVLMTLGSPGIPGGLFISTTIFLTTLGLPVEFVGLLGGIIRIVDMGITTVNVVGSICIAVFVDASERKSEEKAAFLELE